MWPNSLRLSWKSGPSRRRRQEPRLARRRWHLALEQLDDRVLLSFYTAANVTALIADINAANAAGGSNTISLTAPTTSPYELTARNNTTNGGNGLPVIAANDNLTIHGHGDTIERHLGYIPFRLLDVAAGASLKLQNLTLYHGFVIGNRGGILNEGTLVLNGVTVRQNYADLDLGQSGGEGAYAGGGIWSNGSLTLGKGTLMEYNRAQGGADGYNPWGPSTPAGAAYGGALYVAGGTANITNTSFTDNLAVGGNDYSALGGFVGNPSGGNAYGGAIYVAAGKVVLTTTTVNNNGAIPGEDSRQATSNGGGLFIANAATVDIDAFTLANTINNSALIDPNIDGTYVET